MGNAVASSPAAGLDDDAALSDASAQQMTPAALRGMSLLDDEFDDGTYELRGSALASSSSPPLWSPYPLPTSSRPRLLAELASLHPHSPLPLQLQYLRYVFQHLSLPSLLAANRVNRGWRGAMSADSRVIVEEEISSPMSDGASPIASPLTCNSSLELLDAAHAQRNRSLEEQPGSPVVDDDITKHREQEAALSVPASNEPVAVETPLSDLELSEDESSSESSSDDDSDSGMARFHREPAPVRLELASSFCSSSGGVRSVGFSAWPNSLVLMIPPRDSWLKYASRSSCLRNAQSMVLAPDSRRICAGGAILSESDYEHIESASNELERERMNSSIYSTSVPRLLPLLPLFPYLTSLHLRLPLERQFDVNGRAIMQSAFQQLSLHLRELTWELLPAAALDANDPQPGSCDDADSISTVAAANNPISPSPPSVAVNGTEEWSEEERTHAFCQAVLDSLPLLSLNSLSLIHFVLPPGSSLAPLASLPRLHSLNLADLTVASAHIRVVRSLSTLTALTWSAWGDADLGLFCEAPPPSLKQLSFSYANFSLIGLRVLCKSSLRLTLHTLTLDSCLELSDSGFGMIASHLRNLTSVSVRQDAISDNMHGEGMVALATLPRLTSIEFIGAGIPLRHVFKRFCDMARDTAEREAEATGGRASSGLKELKLEQIQLAAPIAAGRTSAIVPRSTNGPPLSTTVEFKHLTQLSSLTSLSVKRCSGASNLFAYISLLSHLRKLVLERRQRHTPEPARSQSSSPSKSVRSVARPGFGSLLDLAAMRLEELHLDYSDELTVAAATLLGPTLGADSMARQIHQLQYAYLARGRRVFITWQGVHIPSPLDDSVADDELRVTVPEAER